ncbi:uncharacterized protein LTR77_008137 [Saxophila tyrrhenica]|uniref:WW domain-containing protein n=1 Tax=Saxophila tyrrhenica TaxID=1690608 RepID=A0AAV9P2K0_9PEZI|nr:hypothetical protein LTR77_008137 [Saxophila tyrrhenica]
MADQDDIKLKDAADTPDEVRHLVDKAAEAVSSTRRPKLILFPVGFEESLASYLRNKIEQEDLHLSFESPPEIVPHLPRTDDKKSTPVDDAANTAESLAELSQKQAEATTGKKISPSEGSEDGEAKSAYEAQISKYRWCKCSCDPAQFYGHDHYYVHLDTKESRWDEPTEFYWLWDTDRQEIDSAGLQRSTKGPQEPTPTAGQSDPTYYGYNPKIHGSYDPTAPYAQYHNQKRKEEKQAANVASSQMPSSDSTGYGMTGTFNRFTGNFQGGDRSAEQHNDYNKSGRQMNAYFDVDAAANAHAGRSLKEERRNKKLSKQELREMSEKRKARKVEKRMEFYKS